MSRPPLTPKVIALTTPPTPAEWRKSLQGLHSLPILPTTRSRVLAAIHHPNSTADSVAREIQYDPVLCLKLFASAQRIMSRRGTEVQRLPHLLSLLGLPQVEQQLRAAPELSAGQIAANPGYTEALTRSLLAARLCAELWSLRHHDPEECFFTGLLASAPLWLLWFRQPTLMEQRRGLLAAGQMPREHIDRLTLGTELQSLIRGMLDLWPLPESVTQLWQIPARQGRQILAAAHRNRLPDLLQRHPAWENGLTSPQWLTLGSQLLADACADAWLAAPAQRLQTALANLLHQPVERLTDCTRQAALALAQAPQPESSLYPPLLARLPQQFDSRLQLPCYCLSTSTASLAATPLPATTAPAITEAPPAAVPDTATTPNPPNSPSSTASSAALATVTGKNSSTTTPLQPDKATPESAPQMPQVEQAAPLATTPKAPAGAQHSNRLLLNANRKRLLERGDSFQNLNQLMGVVADTLAEGLGLPLVGLLLLNRERSQLRCHFERSSARESEGTTPLHNLQLPLSGKDSFLSRLLQQPAGLLLNEDNRQRLCHVLPTSLQSLCRESDMAFMSLFNGDKALGLALASAPRIHSNDYADFRQCCLAANKAIGDFARHRHRS